MKTINAYREAPIDYVKTADEGCRLNGFSKCIPGRAVEDYSPLHWEVPFCNAGMKLNPES